MTGYNIPRSALEPITHKAKHLTTAEARALSDDELFGLLSGETLKEDMLSLPAQNVIQAELLRRALEKATVPHWTLTPSFGLLVLSVVLAAVGAVAAIAALPQAQALLSQSQKPVSKVEPAEVVKTTQQPLKPVSEASQPNTGKK